MNTILGYEEAYLKKINGLKTAEEIRQQPRIWKETLGIVKRYRDEIKTFIDKVTTIQGIRVIFTGAGTSSYVGQTVTPYLNKKTGLRMEAIPTTEIVSDPEGYLLPDVPTLLISFARSGNSPESVAAINIAESMVKELYQIVITCNPEGELAKRTQENANGLLLFMPEASNDRGFAMTSSFTSMTLASLLIFENLDEIEGKLDRIAINGERILTKYAAPLKELANTEVERVIFLGSSIFKGLAAESALKSLELTNGKIMGVHESPLELRHGPKTMINDKTIIFFYLSDHAYTLRYEMDLLNELTKERKYRELVVISPGLNSEAKQMGNIVWPVEEGGHHHHDDVYLILNYILFAQMFALFQSIRLGITPDNPDPEGSVNRVVKGVIIYPFSPNP